ncbi:MAG: CDP-glycerol glycerophosphotransferase family protein, partial [Firmicutes bacterium]|nr:CDP-glycerol glycerophosphotransferase family protein [Bacillota bacterium]
ECTGFHIEKTLISVYLYESKYNLIIKTDRLSGVPSDCPEFNSFDMLTIADRLISDYSCIIYESAILGTPLFFYTYDYEEYTETRAIYMDYPNEIPSRMCSDPEELLSLIDSASYDFSKHSSFLSKYVAYEKDDITKNIVDFIWDHLK